MPFYPLKKIGALARSQQVYLRGVGGYNAGWVRQYETASNAFYSEYITAQVAEKEERVCTVEIGFESEEPTHIACTCAAARSDAGVCKHAVAVLVYKYYHDMVNSLPTAASLMKSHARTLTEPSAMELIDYYLSRPAETDDPAQEQALLIPTLSLHRRVPVLTFTVGAGRPYVVRDIGRFVQAVRQEETLTYGKQLTLTHCPDCFAPQSRALLDFVLAEAGEHPYAPVAGANASELMLTVAGFDRFFALMRGQSVRVRLGGEELPLMLTDGAPDLPVEIRKAAGGVRICAELTPFTAGVRTLYFVQDGRLLRTDAAFSRRMSEFLTVCGRCPGGFFIAEKELPSFCSSVLNTVEPYIRLTGDTDLLEQFRPRRLEVQLYLDAPEPDVITARVLYVYGQDTIQPFLESGGAEEPWRDPLAEKRARQSIVRHFTALRPDSGLLVLRGTDDEVYDFITRGVEALRRVGAVYASDTFDRLMPAAPPQMAVGVSLNGDLLELDMDIPAITAQELAGILTGYREHKPFHRLAGGRFVTLDDGVLAGLAEMADGLALTEQELRTGHIALPKYRALYLEKVLRERDGLYVRRDEQFRTLTERCRTAAENDFSVPASLAPILRQYQHGGFRWLCTMEELGFGGILADDMGLGKTVQVLALLLAAKERGATEPSLVVCPTSLVLGWEREAARFTPDLRVLCVIGDAPTRRQLLSAVGDYDLIITSYDMLKRDLEEYAPLRFHYHILDEAQYIKNSHTQNAKAVKAIHSRQRFALTGTPVENRLSELWSIFDFLMPGILFSYARFRARFEYPIVRLEDERALERLNRMVSPFILRRLKQDVLTELPPKTERVLPATMDDAQETVYRAALYDLQQQLRAGQLGGKKRVEVLAMLTRLRQICCDPRLCCEGYTGGSGKLEACIELLRQASAGGHKVLLFSQFTSMLALIRERLDEEGLRYYVLQGSTPKEERAALVDAFNADATDVFLISLKAGGTGLNLTGADVVIHYDPWWNLSVQNQATDRAHRIGQKNPVQVIRLVARDTVEEKILRLQDSKWELARQVIAPTGEDITTMSADELLAILED